MDYKRKIDFGIKLLRSIPQDGPIEISYSGGKDSDVILRLAQMAGIPHEAIYKQTSIDPPGTTAHAKEMGATIIPPKMRFFDIVRKKGYPTRFNRFCCQVLKEYKIYDRAVQGVRREESTARAKRYKEPEICRLYPKGDKARVYLPILEWTLEDVVRFIDEQGIKCAPCYYDADGIFRPERRLGCVICPLATDNGIAGYKQYPKLLKQACSAAQTFIDTHPKSKAAQIRKDGYEIMMDKLFFQDNKKWEAVMGDSLFPEMRPDAKQYLENYFGIEL